MSDITRCCSILGCGRPIKGHGLCDAHRKRVNRHGDLDAATPIGTRPRESWLPTDVLVEDVEWMLAAREHPDMIARRIGYSSRHNLESAILRRTGRRDLMERMRGLAAA